MRRLLGTVVLLAAVVGSNVAFGADSADTSGVGLFDAQIVLTPDEGLFRALWRATGETAITSTNHVTREGAITALLLLRGCAPDARQLCDVVAEFSVETMDGQIVSRASGSARWHAPPPQEPVNLADGSAPIHFDAAAPLGQYRVVAVVTDRVSGRRFMATRWLKLIA